MTSSVSRPSRSALTAPPAPAWAVAASLVLSLLGLGISVYLSIEHASGSVSLACPETGTIDCAKVTSSTYSRVAGIPVAYLGTAFFVVAVIAMLPIAWLGGRAIGVARLLLVCAGLGFVFYLVWAELFRLHAICLWCTGVHVMSFLLFAVTLLGEALRAPAPSE